MSVLERSTSRKTDGAGKREWRDRSHRFGKFRGFTKGHHLVRLEDWKLEHVQGSSSARRLLLTALLHVDSQPERLPCIRHMKSGENSDRQLS